jgi:K+-transporting ATPase ATPase C chain
VRATLRQTLAALRLLLVMTVLLGLAYPLAVSGVALAFPVRARGSLVTDASGAVVGSRLLGQEADGEGWFRPRPSVAGYDPLASGGSNLGPNNPDLLATVEERRAAVAAREGVDPAAVPPDALTASGSGLDPDISPEYARLQVPRVARERGLPMEEVSALVEDHVVGRALGFIGSPTVNVLELNLALAAADAAQG